MFVSNKRIEIVDNRTPEQKAEDKKALAQAIKEVLNDIVEESNA